MWFISIVLGLVINTINIPFDNGANILGSKNAPQELLPYFDFLNIKNSIDINTDNFITNILNDGYYAVLQTICNNSFPIIIGGDHTVSICSIGAINDYYNSNNKSLGILWCDAHADFNTMDTSPTKNIHGMPIAVLCGHTLHNLKIGDDLNPSQFAYYGLRDVDDLEFLRLKKYKIPTILTIKELENWMEKFDYIHVSFDIDCLDPSVTKCVNTPVPDGITINQIKEIFKNVKKSKKLCSLDIVEYNSYKGDDQKIIREIIKELF